jgi:hypothetical protein
MNTTDNNDQTYVELGQKVIDAANETEAKAAMIECDMYTLENHWGVITFPTVNTVYWHSRLKGNPSEHHFSGWRNARLWIDEG